MTAPGEAAISLSQVFLTTATFRHVGNPLALPPDTPHKSQPINVAMGLIELNEGNAHQVVVRVESKETDGAFYEFMIEMAAIMTRTEESPPTHSDQLLELGTAFLYPFIREAVANITGRGRFGPVWLNPFNVKTALAARQEPTAET